MHTPNLEELNIKKTSQVLISGIHGAPESGCSDSSPPPRCNISPLNLISPPGQYTLYHIMEGNTQDYLHQKLSAEQVSLVLKLLVYLTTLVVEYFPGASLFYDSDCHICVQYIQVIVA